MPLSRFLGFSPGDITDSQLKLLLQADSLRLPGILGKYMTHSTLNDFIAFKDNFVYK